MQPLTISHYFRRKDIESKEKNAFTCHFGLFPKKIEPANITSTD